MKDPAHDAQRRALTEIISRRTLFGASLLGVTGLQGFLHEADTKKKKRKKRCRNGAKRCGKGCCKTPSICSAASCFCTGNEGKCKSIPAELIAIIAEELGVSPDQIGQNPGQPLAGCDEISLQDKDDIDALLKLEFGIIQNVPWCTGGISAGADAIREQLTQKA